MSVRLEKAYQPIAHDESTYADHISSVPLAVAGTKLDSLPNFDNSQGRNLRSRYFL